MAYEVVMPYHLHMPSYFLETFTEYPYVRMKLYIRTHMPVRAYVTFMENEGINSLLNNLHRKTKATKHLHLP